MKATIVDLRYRMKDVLKAVERGEAVTVLHRGKEKALIVPLGRKPDRAKVASHPAFGIWEDRADLRDVSRHLRSLRRGRFRDL